MKLKPHFLLEDLYYVRRTYRTDFYHTYCVYGKPIHLRDNHSLVEIKGPKEHMKCWECKKIFPPYNKLCTMVGLKELTE